MSGEHGGQEHPHPKRYGNRFGRTWLTNIMQDIQDDIRDHDHPTGKMSPYNLLPE